MHSSKFSISGSFGLGLCSNYCFSLNLPFCFVLSPTDGTKIGPPLPADPFPRLFSRSTPRRPTLWLCPTCLVAVIGMLLWPLTISYGSWEDEVLKMPCWKTWMYVHTFVVLFSGIN